MKTYNVEPTYKKSVIEYNVWKKELEDGSVVHATMELGWRWGEFTVYEPETEEEILQWANDRVGDPNYYSNIQEVLDDYGYDSVDEMEFIPNDSEECNFHEMSDYEFDMDSTWDGCWEDWNVVVFGEKKDDHDVDELREQVEEGWYEDSWDFMEQEGWEELDCYYEIHCPVTVTPTEDNPADDVSADFKDDQSS